MLFRYDLGQKPDLSKFRKQAMHYIGTMRELSYDLTIPDFRVRVNIATPDDANAHNVSIEIHDIHRDKASSNEIIGSKTVIPMIDTRFNEIKLIQEMFPRDHYVASFVSNSAQETVNRICQLMKLVSKINGLRAFI